MSLLDETDRALLALLRDDARQPLTSLAAALDLSRATVKARIDRLVERGIIQGFTVVLRREAEPAPIRAITLVEIEGNATERVTRRLQGLPQVAAIHATNGRWDLVLEIEVASLEAFDATLREIRHIEGVANSESNLLLARRKG
ncbi:Lrp/AsnC family transcriptional regulator [Pseudoroseomonas cervicalis]|uniref:Transcriptional regulator, AsnC family n=1 Tax=Pseudoroseomonas cervicalis ATCC 49957 TaxID=525371 RepID=D5RIV3_9PROT|nr:Lrp/AsnC family transcriptional regulator [Pseudoroseomonas cervicalis]EFH12775.1 transcriptional regulator, AsnC family [Pseudoroseomonas cervicalis ATCC 49957]WBV44253.1 Lrp/AsnC family transcriptional regulator [Pseudoroseomonas cervicalis]